MMARIEAARSGADMRRRNVLILAAFLLVAPTGAARADPTDDYIKSQMEAFHLPGVALAVVRNGEIVKAAGYGVADATSKTPVRPETVFKIGSVSKQFIATGIMLLVQDGRLQLGDPIDRFLDGAPAAWRPITVRHLLTHTSGLVRECPGFDPHKVQADAEVIRTAYAVPLLFTPGEKWAYSNAGYYILAEIIRKVSGQAWAQFLNEKVFERAAMAATFPTNGIVGRTQIAVGYTGNDNRRAADHWAALRPSGAFSSTVLDLARWDALLYSDSVLSETSRHRMWSAVQLNNGSSAPYGLGWHVSSKGRRRVWHGGGTPGFNAQFVRFLDDRLTIILLINGDDVDDESIAIGVANLYLPD